MAQRYLILSGRPSEVSPTNTKLRHFFKENYVAGEGYDEKSFSFERSSPHNKRGYVNLFLGEGFSIHSYFRTRTTIVDNQIRGLMSKLIVKVNSEDPKKLVDLCLGITSLNEEFEVSDYFRL